MSKRAFFPFSIVGALLSACIALVAHSGADGVPTEALLSGERKTYCFGRHLVDLPIDAELKRQESFYGVANIYAEKGKRGDFLARQKSVRAEKTYVPEEILNEKSRKRGEQLLHRKQSAGEELRPEDWRFLMEFEEAQARDAARRAKYAYLRSEYPENGDQQILVSKIRFQEADYALDAFVHPGGEYFFSLSGEDYPEEVITEVISLYRNLLSSIRPRQMEEIPAMPGFCIEHGFIADDGSEAGREDTTLVFQMKSHPDIVVEIESSRRFSAVPGLLESQQHARVVEHFPAYAPDPDRKPGLIQAKSDWIIKRLRAGERTLHDMPGEESLVSFPADNAPGEAHLFSWATRGEIGNPQKPYIRLEIRSGEDRYTLVGPSGEQPISGALLPASVGVEEMQALYESIVQTIRPRPTKGGVKK
jgi:hypothetical protein